MESQVRDSAVYVVADDEFRRQLILLRQTRRFLLEQGISATPPAAGVESPFSLGRLNMIQIRKSGPPPTAEDWQLLEEKQSGLQPWITPDLAHRFRLQGIRQTLIWVPVALLIYAGLALAIAIFPPKFGLVGSLVEGPNEVGWRYFAYLMWTSGLGALGSLGFLAVNSLGIQRDATFDLSDKALVALRIILGALFGSIVAVPFFYPDFAKYAQSVVAPQPTADLTSGVPLLVPFLLGFSTSLAMAVLNRLVSGVETIFGIERGRWGAGKDPARDDPRSARDQPRLRPTRTAEILPLEKPKD
jgi:hypothetical protein